MLIRPVVPEDIDARVALHRACVPFSVATPAIMGTDPAEPDPHRLRLAAEVDGRLVATCGADLDDPARGAGSVNVMVLPEHRGAGIGAGLYARAEAHLAAIGARHVTASVFEETSRSFAERRGFAAHGVTRVATFDPREASGEPAPDGITLRAGSELPDLRAFHELDLAFGPDLPLTLPYAAKPFEEWLARRDGVIPLDPELCFVAYDGDLPVAMTLTAVTEDRMLTTRTGTRPGHRRRSLARAVKVAALTAGAKKGMTRALTWNGAKNTAIIAANESLGYRLHTEITIMVRES
ncbi:GNAT family N-acetyltransferase [Actinorhabdospora filicis]|uniref:GNAT family N-acetyltransferase n=1 Tax=Actinorhabdospora filicis TaxID=1785913 RepID=A0A9W6SIJ1_9ACTN|nr:GNAT family N-acetyltransferase [Actinorhabdospora filicis]GLZ75296.1 GNAT family N-acetyltransferase [Actinorhabdospora filicis]